MGNNDLKTTSQASKQATLVVTVLVVAIIISVFLIWLKPVAEKKASRDEPPYVETITAVAENIPVPVTSQGTVRAGKEIRLIAEVSGRINYLAEEKMNGAFFQQGDLLLAIDDTDYRLALRRSEAQMAAAQQQLERVRIEAEQARQDLKQIGRATSTASDYALKKPHLAEAEANLRAAKADQEIARLQLNRSRITAPFNGRAIQRQVDVGQYVNVGTQLAEIYSIEKVEVSLPLSLDQLNLLGMHVQGHPENKQQISIKLRADISSELLEWDAEFSHIESQLDIKNRLLNLVVKVERPFELSDSVKAALTPGMFVRAYLRGVPKPSVFQLPRSTLRASNTIWIIDENNQLEIRNVELYTKDEQHIYVSSGLQSGDRVVLGAIDYPVHGMQLSIEKNRPANE